jgi:hypothetical protein
MTDSRDNDSGDNPRWMRGAPRSLISRGSRIARVPEFDKELGEWRMVIKMTKRKILDEEKGIFLREYAKWGRIDEAAAAIDCARDTVKAEMKRDPEFAEACLLAEYAYRDKLISHHQDLLFNGTQKDSYDRNGNLVSTETIYPIRLIELELKKHDAGYRDKQEVDVRVSGGVLVAPAAVASVDDWEARFSIAKDVTPVDRATDEETD